MIPRAHLLEITWARITESHAAWSLHYEQFNQLNQPGPEVTVYCSRMTSRL
jgi:hypothetical protein